MYIASVSDDVKIHMWPNGHLLHTYKSNFQGYIKSISWGKDGSWLVVVPNKGAAEVISVKDNIKHLHSIQEIQQPTCAAFQNSTKRNIALGTTTGAVLVYDIKSKSVRKHFPRAPSTIFKVEYCAKDSFLIAACENGEILLYNGVTYNLSSSYKVPNSRTVSNVRCHPIRRNLVIAGSQEGMVAQWDIHTSKLRYSNLCHAAPVTDLAYSPCQDDTIVTCGLDRKLAFFDTATNTCIVQKIMENSATSVDFCPDGIGLAVAMHNGIIHTYDTRHMNEPLYSFSAHQAQVKQLLFQKKPCDDSFEYKFADEKLEVPGDSFHGLKETTMLGKTFDSLGQFCGDILPDIPEVRTEDGSEEVGDSFMDAMGLMSHNVTNQSMKHESLLGISDGVKKLLDSKPNLLESSSRSSPRMEKISKHDNFSHVEIRCQSEDHFNNETEMPVNTQLEHVKLKSMSTPKGVYKDNVCSPFFSPIHGNVGETISPAMFANCNFKEFQNSIRESVKAEMKLEMENFKQQLKYEFMDIMAQMRRHFLDLQMSIVKEFVQMESNFNRFKEDMNAEECFGDDMLVQENMRLRKELATLREQIVSTADD